MSSFLFSFFGLLTLLALLEAGLARSLGKRPLRRALLLSLLWLTFSVIYGGYLGKTRGLSAALDFGAMYGLEYLLSIDNLFAFYGTFRLFRIRGAAQGHLLTVGVLLAVLLRALLIWAGLSLVRKYEAVFPLFGILLFVAAVRLSRKPDSEPVIPGARLLGNLSPPSEGERPRGLRVRCGRTLRSPRLLALLSIELADLLFALDSVPAAFAITLDPTVVFPANLCAVMGLRSLYPLVQHAADNLQWLNRAIPWVLALMGGELCLKPWLSVPTLGTAVLIASLFLVAFLASARRKGLRNQGGP
jgi:tellurite resistance protein TerC